MSKGKILFQLSGSIAAFKACALISKLVQAGYEIETVATKSALAFIGEATLEGLTGRRAHTETFAAGEYMKHIHLMRWADLALLCPASANVMAKMAAGVADDLVTTLFLAHDFSKPYLVAPAMNRSMMAHPATQASLAKLRAWGLEVLEAGEGALACGEVGEGRLLEPDDLFARIEASLGRRSARSRKILVTAGGTREPIDSVRAITNLSSGRTGAAIANALTARGHEVTMLRAESAHATRSAHERTFVTFEDLRRLLSEELGSGGYDTIIHAAAVSDYSVASVEGASGSAMKLDSSGDLTIRLKKNLKLVDSLRDGREALRVIAFKLTNTTDANERQSAVMKLAERARPDLIVHNDLSEIRGEEHPTHLYLARDGRPREFRNHPDKAALARALAEFIEGVPS